MSVKMPLVNPSIASPKRTLPVLSALLISIFMAGCDPGVLRPPLEQDAVLYDVAGTQGVKRE